MEDNLKLDEADLHEGTEFEPDAFEKDTKSSGGVGQIDVTQGESLAESPASNANQMLVVGKSSDGDIYSRGTSWTGRRIDERDDAELDAQGANNVA